MFNWKAKTFPSSVGVLVFPVNGLEYEIKREQGKKLRRSEAAFGRLICRRKFSEYSKIEYEEHLDDGA